MKIRQHNNTFAMASSGMKMANPPGFSMLAVRGAAHHYVAPPHPVSGNDADRRFAQLYVVDTPAREVEIRVENSTALGVSWTEQDKDLMRQLQEMLHTYNRHVQQFKQMGNFPPEDVGKFDYVFKTDGTIDKQVRHPGRYNAPTAGQGEVAGFMAGGEDSGGDREFKVYCRNMDGRDSNAWEMGDLHPLCDPLRFVLFHPRGEPGFTADMKQAGNGTKKLTLQQATRFYLHDRSLEHNHAYFTYGARLYQEWAIDQYCKIEHDRLNYLRFNQKKIRADVYQGIVDSVNAGDTSGIATNLGRRIVLPSSFSGGPRAMQQGYQDAIALVRKFGKPDLFITMTCNPNWPEIKAALMEGQTVADRPDLAVRVFQMKLEKLLEDLKGSGKRDGLFGKCVAQVHVVEFQKRGLPHAHILLILAPEDKPLLAEQIDEIVSAELPDERTHPVLHAIVTRCMLHGPCGTVKPTSPCMKDGSCSKRFPKAYQNSTQVGRDSFPLYKRRSPEDGGRTFIR